ncbi:MAG: GHMP kinase [Thermoplasmata archaeon]|nr:GHMP kinase [Thermoplasmata archaeon]
MMIRSKAPLRISFGGGGTDVSPYIEERGGCVLSSTINKFAYATLVPVETPGISVQSLDYDIVVKYDTDRDLVFNGELDLVKAVIRRFMTEEDLKHRGVKMFIHSDAPPGSGLGSSSTMAVALIGVMKHWKRTPMTDYEVAELAYEIERKDLKIPGGKQDQYAAAFGGFNFIEFMKDATIVNPLKIERETLNELEYRCLLCYTGKTRLSGNILNTQIKNYAEKKPDVVEALDETKRLALEMKKALLTSKLDDFGELMHEAWMHKRKFANGITNPTIDGLYEVARKNGAIGGKLLGAGGGGYILFICKFDKKHEVARELENLGGKVIDFSFEFKGLQTWSVYQY